MSSEDEPPPRMVCGFALAEIRRAKGHLRPTLRVVAGTDVRDSRESLMATPLGKSTANWEASLTEEVRRFRAEPQAEPIDCVVCSPWPPEKRAWLRESLNTIPLRATVCDLCMESWWKNLPWGPPLNR
jgi:hypothetical protein